MNSRPKIFGFILARGGSKGLPRKNIRLLVGKPLISYSIEAGLQCKNIDRVIVSTEDPEIKKISIDWGAEVIDRPKALATDNIQSSDVVLDVLNSLERKQDLPDYFVLIQPTSPLRNALHLEKAIQLCLRNNANCVIGVTEEEHHPYKDFKLESGFLSPFFDAPSLEKPRQILPVVYRQNGAIYVLKTSVFRNEKRFFVPPALPLLMKNEESIDIDTQLDFLVAEILLTRKLNDKL